MKRPFSKKSEYSRRDVAARRQAELMADDNPSQHSYRRNRTLNSPNTSTPAETSERAAIHKLAKKRKRLVRHLVWILVAGGLVLLLLWEAVLSMSIISPQPLSLDDTNRYKATLESYFGERPIERFRFMIDQQSLDSFFLAKAPEAKKVRVEGHGLATAQVKMTFRQPIAQWASSGTTYFVDDEGVTFQKNYFEAPAITVRDESGVPTVAGQEVINRQFLSFLGQAVSLFGKNDMTVTEVILPADTVRQMTFQLKDRPYPIKMTIDRGVDAQVKQAVLAIRHLDSQGSMPQYLDVRVDQRVFYK